MRTERLHHVAPAAGVARHVQTELIMGLPITIIVTDSGDLPGRRAMPARSRQSMQAREEEMAQAAAETFDYFRTVDEQFSPYKESSEVSRINRGELSETEYSPEMKRVLRLCEQTKRETHGYFDPWWKGRFDPSGIVKGLSTYDAASILKRRGFENFCIEAGGDIEVRGRDAGRHKWRIGIRNPFNPDTIIKTVVLENMGIATSGLYVRGEHIYNPITGENAREIASFTVIGPNVYEADRLATAAFAMGKGGLDLIASFSGFDAYMVEYSGIATYTDGFLRYVTL